MQFFTDSHNKYNDICSTKIHRYWISFEKSYFCVTTDKPGPPGKPEVTDSDTDHITLKWAPPSRDGGAPITGYNVERLDPKTGRWTKVNSEPITVHNSSLSFFSRC